MVEIIVFSLIIATAVFFPYRKVFHRLNGFVDARTVLTGAALIAFPFIWRALGLEEVDTPSPVAGADFNDRFSHMTASLAETLGWIMTLVGIVMIGFAIWQAREHRKQVLNKKGLR